MALLDWRDSRHWSNRAEDCVICDKPTNLRSDRGKPVHKVCAEDWIESHPDATAPSPYRGKRRR